ncbi:MAG TPA: aminotransferase class III-fold pyridoxal phosphate-dependent enzyme [Vicinamibacterales bacterium]|nr:aminotransferase class III-fold pyridoxal phosphate-dependent enzyme [Vicinamibacterales bacterium]
MSVLEQAPRFDAAGAERLARDLYGLEAAASPLPGERDQNFLLTTVRGERFVLKIANPAEPLALLEAQNAALARLEPLGICPRVVPTPGGEAIAGADGYRVRLLTWIHGAPLGAVARRPRHLLEEVGRRLGQLSAALDGFDHPALHRRFPWDLQRGFDVVARHSPLVADPALRELVRRVAGYVRARDGRRLARLRRSAVHNDANDYNVLVDPSDDGSVTGILDLGDIVHSYVVAEPAIAVAYAVLDDAEPLEAAAAVVRGFHAMRPLGDDELSVLFGLVLLRLCVSVCMAAAQLRERPGDEYLAISQAPIRRTLPALASIPPDVAEDTLRRACGLDPRFAEPSVAADVTRVRRAERIGPNLSLAYADPVKVTRGWMQYLFDETGRRYLDAYNNVPHVGHAHPRVVAAAAEQMRRVNTNTRYLHDALWRLAEALCATLPEPLRVCYFVNSGSEANELALRIARAVTGRRDVIVLDAAYHGNTTTLIDISPYKFNGPGGDGAPDWVHVAPLPDDYRGPFVRADPAAGRSYGHAVGRLIEAMAERRRQPGAFICETCPSVGGQIVPPPGYLETAYRHVRAAGGVCIADEVQTALGRMGDGFYAFESQGVVPDIVVLGKPLGNGYPLAAVVTTRALAHAFDTGMEFFSTFGGSTVSCAAGLAVLEVVRDEALQAHALRMGARLLADLRPFTARHELVGDVRGRGLFLGIELVRDRATLVPAAREAAVVVNRLRDRGILLGTDGPFHNVLKIRPPMPFADHDADRLVEELDDALGRVAR